MNITCDGITRLMVDIETMDTVSNAAVVQIGAVVIEPDLSITRQYVMAIDPEDARKYGMVGVATMKWWDEQETHIREHVFAGKELSFNVVEDFAAWVESTGATEVWAQGPQFDLVVLENLYRAHSRAAPWAYNAGRDLRTLKALFDARSPLSNLAQHDALADANKQANDLVTILKRLRSLNQ